MDDSYGQALALILTTAVPRRFGATTTHARSPPRKSILGGRKSSSITEQVKNGSLEDLLSGLLAPICHLQVSSVRPSIILSHLACFCSIGSSQRAKLSQSVPLCCICKLLITSMLLVDRWPGDCP